MKLYVQFEIIRKIRETVEICSLSLFIFDESDKMPARLLDQIQHYLERNTRSISIFLRYYMYSFIKKWSYNT